VASDSPFGVFELPVLADYRSDFLGKISRANVLFAGPVLHRRLAATLGDSDVGVAHQFLLHVD
jgi:hypothetical protein